MSRAKKIISGLALSAFLMTVIPWTASQAFIFNHREKCYGLPSCKGKGPSCYVVMKKRECEKAGGSNKPIQPQQK